MQRGLTPWRREGLLLSRTRYLQDTTKYSGNDNEERAAGDGGVTHSPAHPPGATAAAHSPSVRRSPALFQGDH